MSVYLLMPSEDPTILKLAFDAKLWFDAIVSPAAYTEVVPTINVEDVSAAAIESGTVTGVAPTASDDASNYNDKSIID